MQIDERVVTTMPPSVMHRNSRYRGLWVRRATVKLILSIRDKYLDKGIDIFNVFVRGDNVEVTLRGDLDITELNDKQKKNRANLMKMRERREKMKDNEE